VDPCIRHDACGKKFPLGVTQYAGAVIGAERGGKPSERYVAWLPIGTCHGNGRTEDQQKELMYFLLDGWR